MRQLIVSAGELNQLRQNDAIMTNLSGVAKHRRTSFVPCVLQKFFTTVRASRAAIAMFFSTAF